MEPEKQPTQMIVDQISLLNSEERKLKKFIDYNKDAKSIIEEHLNEIQEKKNRLFRLCQIMGINIHEPENNHDMDHESIGSQKFPQPSGRFGSVLINWHHDKGGY